MQLIRSAEHARYEVLTRDWSEKDVPKAAKCCCDRDAKRWYTNDHAIALTVAAHPPDRCEV